MIGIKVITLAQIDSTNRYAANLLESGRPEEGTVIMAEFQEKGHGQRDSVWESEKGKNLLCSIILYPSFLPVRSQFLINQAISLSVVSLVEELAGVKACIKWPNDILVNERKIAGILIENSLRVSEISSTIAGIGLNVNQLVFKDYQNAAVSLASLTGRDFDIGICSKQLFSRLDHYYGLVQDNRWQELNDLYMKRLFRLHVPAMYELDEKPVQATIKGVTQEGELVLELTNGTLRYIRTREIRYLI